MNTEEEREALADILMSDAVMRSPGMGRDYALAEADAVLDAGFRRQGRLMSAEEEREALQAEVDRRYPPYPITTGWSYEDAAQYEGIREGLLEGLSVGFRRQEPITDAQVEAALDAFYGSDLRRGSHGPMRAALEAARDAS